MTAPLEVIESGFHVIAPRPAFRFADCSYYQSLSGKNLKEMDVCWQDVAPNGAARLIVLELKGITVWSTVPDDPTKPHEHLVKTCVAKATDVLLMLAAAWLKTVWGQQFGLEVVNYFAMGDEPRYGTPSFKRSNARARPLFSRPTIWTKRIRCRTAS